MLYVYPILRSKGVNRFSSRVEKNVNLRFLLFVYFSMHVLFRWLFRDFKFLFSFFHAPQEDLLRGREVRRIRYGTDIDFADYKPNFQKHITVKAEAMEAEDN